MAAVVLIPARYGSTRFPGKPVVSLLGKPVIQHVYENASRATRAAEVIVATDSETIFETVLSFGGKAVMTSTDHASGTDRIAEAAREMEYDIIVNVQGDEPLIRPEMIDEVIDVLDDSRASIGTLVTRIREAREIADPNVVKAVFDDEGFALYFSRAPIPFHRDEWKGLDRVPAFGAQAHVFKHIGIYSYRRDALIRMSGLPPSRLEQIEKLEQLRALVNGLRIKVRETVHETFGVDTPEDLERIARCLSTSS